MKPKNTRLLLFVVIAVPLLLALSIWLRLESTDTDGPLLDANRPEATIRMTAMRPTRSQPEALPPFDPQAIVRTARNRFLAGPEGVYSDNGYRRVELSAAGVDLTPYREGAPDPSSVLRLQLLEVRQGAQPIYKAPAAAGALDLPAADVASYQHSSTFQEAYYALDFGLAQVLVLNEALVEDAELSLSFLISTSLEPGLTPAGEFVAPLRGTQGIVYGEILVSDALGRSLPLRPTWQGERLRVRVPADWLAGADYPLTIRATLQVRLNLALEAWDQVRPALAGSDVHGDYRYLLVWAEQRQDDWDIYGRFVGSDGAAPDPPFNISAAGGDQVEPAVAYDAIANRYLVVWTSQEEEDAGIYGRLVQAKGSLSGEAFPISESNASGGQGEPAVAASSTPQGPRYLVTWTDESADPGFADVRGRLVQADGSLGPALSIAGTAGRSEGQSAVAYDGSRAGWLVVWARGGDDGGAVVGRMIEISGPAADDEIEIGAGPTGQGRPRLACHDGAGRCMVAWEREEDGRGVIYARRLGAGDALETPLALYQSPGDQRHPTVAYNPQQNEYLVVWQEGGTAIRAQQLSGSGEILGGLYTLDAGLYGRSWPVAAWDDLDYGQYLVVWQGASSPLPEAVQDGGIYGQLFRPYILVDDYDGDRRQPAIAHDNHRDQYLLVWQRDGDIYGRQLSRLGEWLGDEIVICAQEGRQISPTVAYGQDRYLVAWTDERSGEANVYGQFLLADGQRAGGNLALSAADDLAQGQPAAAYDPSGQQYLVVWSSASRIDGCLVQADFPQTPLRYLQDLSGEGGQDGDPAVAANPQALPPDDSYRFLVVWRQRRSGQESETCQVRGVHVSAAGERTGTAFDVLPEAASCGRPTVAYEAATGNYLVAAAQHDLEQAPQLYGSLVSALGLVGEALVLGGEGGAVDSPWSPAIAVHGEAFWLAWISRGGGYILGRRVDPVEGTASPSTRLFGPTPDTSAAPALACDDGSRCLLVYEGGRAQIYASFLWR